MISWNESAGQSLNSEITLAWDAAQSAAQRYGDFVSAIMGGISNEIDGITKQIKSLDERISNLSTSGSYGGRAGGGSNAPIKNTTVGNKTTYTTPTDEEMVETIVKRMKEYSAMWTPENAGVTHKKAEDLANQLDQYNIHADYDEKDGTWWITEDRLHPENKNKLLYNCYHTGGFVGKEPLKPNERFIKAENGEFVMTADQQDSFAAQIEQIRIMTEAFSHSLMSMPVSAKDMWPDGLAGGRSSSVSNVTNNSSPVEIHMGDITINAPSGDGKIIADEVRKITRENMNEIARQFIKP